MYTCTAAECIYIHIHTYIHIHRYIHTSNIYMYIHTISYIHTCMHAYIRTDRQTDRQTGSQTGRQAGRQTDRQTTFLDPNLYCTNSQRIWGSYFNEFAIQSLNPDIYMGNIYQSQRVHRKPGLPPPCQRPCCDLGMRT